MANLENGQKRAIEFEARRMEEDIAALAKLPEFRRFMWRLCQRCGFTDVVSVDSGSEMFRVTGRRMVAVEVLTEIDGILRQSGPHYFYRLVIEAAQAFKREMEMIKPDKPSGEEN